jgi:hypothetical protein
MTRISRTFRQAADFVGHTFGRLAAMIIGLVMTAAGIGMTATIVMLPVGIIVWLLGVAIFVGGLFAHVEEPERSSDH